VAALKCRQRKKQWLNNLQAKVDAYSHDNEILSSNVKALESQVMQLRTLLLAHKDCTITQQQGLTPQSFMQFINGEVSFMPPQQSMGLQPVGPLAPQGVPMMMTAQGTVVAGQAGFAQ
jgi:ATF/CREB family transcription factor